ncbi:MAG: hypothetical protein JXA82_16575, partial [Sedimentisphaerales bacterium]|nr:hypothetical protein [Sedimentisphaerales bacterium]
MGLGCSFAVQHLAGGQHVFLKVVIIQNVFVQHRQRNSVLPLDPRRPVGDGVLAFGLAQVKTARLPTHQTS